MLQTPYPVIQVRKHTSIVFSPEAEEDVKKRGIPKDGAAVRLGFKNTSIASMIRDAGGVTFREWMDDPRYARPDLHQSSGGERSYGGPSGARSSGGRGYGSTRPRY